jgi:hypothetical protein
MTGLRAVWAAWQYAKCTAPSWALIIPAGDLVVPGPLDGSVIAVVTLARLATSGQARRELAAFVLVARSGREMTGGSDDETEH